MTEPQDILFGAASQTFVYDSPHGVPSAITVAVYDDAQAATGTAELATTGSASADSTATTVDAASGDGEQYPAKINVTATTGFERGRTYLITSLTYGYREFFEVAHIDAGDALYAKAPLLNTYAVNDTISSTRMSIAVLASWAADTAKQSDPLNPTPRYRVEWTYTADGKARRGCSWADLHRITDLYTVTPADVDARFPGWLQRLPIDERINQGERLIRQAYREVVYDLVEHGKADSAQRNGPLVNQLILCKARVLSHESNFDNGGNAALAQLERAERLYQQRFNLIRDPKVHQQVTADGAGAVPDRGLASIVRR